MKNSKLLLRLLGGFLVLLLAAPLGAHARETDQAFSREELAQMLAPVALYPDGLLSQVLMAATYPLEIVAADRWLKKNQLLKGRNLDEALRDHDWDASVKSLCHVPALLGLMSERLDETTRLGDAFLDQKSEVMETIQDLRSRAMREGNLKSDDKQKVTVLADGTIVIEPAEQESVYVPYYNTRYVYGPWWYPAWPPWYWGPGEVVVGSGIYFWPDFFFGFGYWSYFDWPGRTIIIDVSHRPLFFHHDYDWDSHRGSWHHEPGRRHERDYREHDSAGHSGRPSEQQSGQNRVVRGPVTAGTGGSAVATPGRVKSGASGDTAERHNEIPARVPTDAGQIGGQHGGLGDSGGGSGHRNRENEARRSPGNDRPVTGPSPRLEQPARPGQEGRGPEAAIIRENNRIRELATDNDDDPGGARDSSYERRGGAGRESRQGSPRERGVPDGEAGRGWGGRR